MGGGCDNIQSKLKGFSGMSRNRIIPYNPKLKQAARELRKNSTLAEVLLWQKINLGFGPCAARRRRGLGELRMS